METAVSKERVSMRSRDVRCRVVVRGGMSAVVGVLVVCLSQVVGCGDYWPTLRVSGKLLDAETLEGATDAALGGRTFTDGEETEFVVPFIYDGSRNLPGPEEDGTFVVGFSSGPVPSSYSAHAEFPRPDRIEIIVVRGDCQYTFSIDINEDTVVDMTFPDDTLELKDPIIVPPCELESGD